jgi:excisionase family DNA binding protein
MNQETVNSDAAGADLRELPAPLPPITYRVDDAVAVSGLSRATLYKLIAGGQLSSVRVAGRRLIPADALRDLLRGAA